MPSTTTARGDHTIERMELRDDAAHGTPMWELECFCGNVVVADRARTARRWHGDHVAEMTDTVGEVTR